MEPAFTRQDLKAAIPERCFRPDTARSFAYLAFDAAVIAGAYWGLSQVSAWYLEAALIFLIGTMLWSVFVIGHDAGHGAFSRSRMVNTLVGLATHGPLLVPYRGWQRSHAMHHMKTGHFREEEVFRPCRAEEDWLARKVLFRSGIFLLIGWPMYKLGFRNLTTYDPVHGSHWLPVSDLYASHVKASWFASLAANLAFLALYIFLGVKFGWVFALKYIVAPYFIYAAWLTFVTYMQHVAPEVPVYDAQDWTSLKGALATVDRNYGPFNWLTHHIGDQHLIHHIFPTIPHYRLAEAMRAVEPIVGDWHLKSTRFVLADFVRTLIGCHFVEPGDGQEVWKSAYPFAENYSGANSNGPETVPAE
ncbi:MAG: fatty acid desaturase [Hyphomonas sp.]|nr:fatty acid desaturase [Hyphomonas sp.]